MPATFAQKNLQATEPILLFGEAQGQGTAQTNTDI